MLLMDMLERQKDNRKIAINYGCKSITYKQWYDYSINLSKKLNEIVGKDSLNIGVFLPNSIDYAISYFSILVDNRIVIPMEVKLKRYEIVSVLEYCEIDVIITNIYYKKCLENNLLDYKRKVVIVTVDDLRHVVINETGDFIVKTDYIANNGSKNDVAIMLHTSGTTNNPKRVMLTHDNLINNVKSNIESLHLTSDDTVLISMPMSFGYCNTAQFLTHLYLGASIVILEGMFIPRLFFQVVQNKRITNFTGVPSMLLMLLEYGESDKYDISSLRYICFGGGKMPIYQLRELIDKFTTVGFVQTYGQTEASPRITALLPKDAVRKIGSVGLPIPNVKIQVVDKNGGTLPSNKIGEVIVQGNNVMKGYYKQQKITENTITDGWLHTGDLGYLDDEGYLYLTGRIKNIIISGGINIYPEEIEGVLIVHPNIKEVCVVPEEDVMWGEVPVAKIVVNDSALVPDYRSFCTNKLADYKVPVRFDVVDYLHKTYNGKIKRGQEW